jgi:prepilin-type N-terminal cleavage/methylation domain-containing protein
MKKVVFKEHGARKQRGMSMLELSVVLVVVALIGAAVYAGLQSNSRRVELQDNQNLVTEISAELQKKFGKTNTYGAVTTALAVQSRAIPDQLRIPGTTTAQNSYGGAITVTPVTLTQVNDAALVTWNNVPQAQCMDLVIGTERGARRVQVAGAVVKPTDGALAVATLAAQCESAGTVAVAYSVGR